MKRNNDQEISSEYHKSQKIGSAIANDSNNNDNNIASSKSKAKSKSKANANANANTNANANANTNTNTHVSPNDSNNNNTNASASASASASTSAKANTNTHIHTHTNAIANTHVRTHTNATAAIDVIKSVIKDISICFKHNHGKTAFLKCMIKDLGDITRHPFTMAIDPKFQVFYKGSAVSTETAPIAIMVGGMVTVLIEVRVKSKVGESDMESLFAVREAISSSQNGIQLPTVMLVNFNNGEYDYIVGYPDGSLVIGEDNDDDINQR